MAAAGSAVLGAILCCSNLPFALWPAVGVSSHTFQQSPTSDGLGEGTDTREEGQKQKDVAIDCYHETQRQ